MYRDCIPYYPFVLGAQPVRPLDLAVFYASIANEGFRPNPYSIETISRGDKILYRHEPSFDEVTLADKVSFYQLKTMLQGVVARGTARRLSHMAPYVAGKTGTTDDENDAWFVGFSNEVTVAVWVGYDNADGYRRTLGSGRTGGNVAIPIFEPIMQAVWAHHSSRTALKPASPEAQRHLAVARPERKVSKSGKAALLPDYLRKEGKGRVVNAQYRLVSRQDQEAFATTRRKPRERVEAPSNTDARYNPWFGGRQWFSWRGFW